VGRTASIQMMQWRSGEDSPMSSPDRDIALRVIHKGRLPALAVMRRAGAQPPYRAGRDRRPSHGRADQDERRLIILRRVKAESDGASPADTGIGNFKHGELIHCPGSFLKSPKAGVWMPVQFDGNSDPRSWL
jgi:hypothetical protein